MREWRSVDDGAQAVSVETVVAIGMRMGRRLALLEHLSRIKWRIKINTAAAGMETKNKQQRK